MLKYNFQFLLILKLPCISKVCPGWLNILLIYRFAYIMIKSCLSSLRYLVCGMSQPLEKARKFLLRLYTGCSGRFYWGRSMTNFTSEIHSSSDDKHVKFWPFRVNDIDSFLFFFLRNDAYLKSFITILSNEEKNRKVSWWLKTSCIAFGFYVHTVL